MDMVLVVELRRSLAVSTAVVFVVAQLLLLTSLEHVVQRRSQLLVCVVLIHWALTVVVYAAAEANVLLLCHRV